MLGKFPNICLLSESYCATIIDGPTGGVGFGDTHASIAKAVDDGGEDEMSGSWYRKCRSMLDACPRKRRRPTDPSEASRRIQLYRARWVASCSASLSTSQPSR